MQDVYRWDVFLSYHHGDKNRVRALAERLRTAGLRVWLDEWVIRPGDDIYAALEEGLEYARTLILCMSQATFGSAWVDTERRTALFRDPQNTDRRFIPLLLEDGQAHIPETIRRFRHVDWRYESDAAWSELLRACQPPADASSSALWDEPLRKSLYETNSASLTHIPQMHRDFVHSQFLKDHEFLHLTLDPETMTLAVSERARLAKFRKAWADADQAVKTHNIETFRTAANNLTALFCASLAFRPCNCSTAFGLLHGHIVDASNPAFQLNVPEKFPIIYMCQENFREEDVFEAFGLLHKFGMVANHFALLVAFDNHAVLRQMVHESAYKNDFIVLDRTQYWEILAAKSPVQRLSTHILTQIDLNAISPYTVAGPVPEKMFFGRSAEEKLLLQTIADNNYALVANRKIGKTSLLNRIDLRLRRLPHYQLFYADLEAVTTYKQFYDWLAETNADWQNAISHSGAQEPSDCYKVIMYLKQHNNHRQIIMIFDEIDRLLAFDLQAQEQLFRVFRSLSQREQVRFIFSGGATLFDRLRHPASPFFNFCTMLRLGFLETDAAYALVTEPMSALHVTFESEEAIVQRILSITARHPNIIQYICDRLIKRINTKQQRTVTLADLEAVVTSEGFYDYSERILWGEAKAMEKFILFSMWSAECFTKSDVLATCAQYGVMTEEIEASLERLHIYSILNRDNGIYSFAFQDFARLIETRRDIPALAATYAQEVLGYAHV